MPNWVSTTATFRSKSEKDLVSLLNVLRENYGEKPLTSLNELDTDKFKYPLSSVVGKMPSIFADYDTTNHSAEGLREMKAKGEKPYSFKEKEIELTDEYIEAFAKAEKEQVEKYGVKGWYDYNCKYLGTKWDTNMGDQRFHDKEYVEFYFDTAWSPAEPVFAKLAEIIKEKNLDIEFEIHVVEESLAFCGVFTNNDGNLEYTEEEYEDEYADELED